jgi:MFS transporter, NNP family, nitrate/nitrite transporter
MMITRQLMKWEPENKTFWEREGKAIASRNLWLSIPALLLAFSVWMVWSMVVLNLPNIGFTFDNQQLFWLVAMPGLSGATLRIFYSFMVSIFGGRLWTTLSTASLLIPAVGIGIQDLTTTYSTFLILSLLCGLGGGNFSSSMTTIQYLFPKAQKGMALGMNAGLGNLGVSLMQFLVPLAISASIFGSLGGDSQALQAAAKSKEIWLQNSGYIWVPFILASTLAAWMGMHHIAAVPSSFREHFSILKYKHVWLMSWLYLGTFGSFIGFSAGLPLLIKIQFPDINPAQYAFLGPLLGALVRPIGGWISDKLGCAVVTLSSFIVMTGSLSGALFFLPTGDIGGDFWGFLTMSMLLFLSVGIGNGATYSMIPAVCESLFSRTTGLSTGEMVLDGAASDQRALAVLGFSAALAAYGAFLIPAAFGISLAQAKGVEIALITILLFYLSCIAITWRYYASKNAPLPC